MNQDWCSLQQFPVPRRAPEPNHFLIFSGHCTNRNQVELTQEPNQIQMLASKLGATWSQMEPTPEPSDCFIFTGHHKGSEPSGTNPGTKPFSDHFGTSQKVGTKWNQLEPTQEPSQIPMLAR